MLLKPCYISAEFLYIIQINLLFGIPACCAEIAINLNI